MAKNLRSVMFVTFGDNKLTQINTTIKADDIQKFKVLVKQKKHLNVYLKWMIITVEAIKKKA